MPYSPLSVKQSQLARSAYGVHGQHVDTVYNPSGTSKRESGLGPVVPIRRLMMEHAGGVGRNGLQAAFGNPAVLRRFGPASQPSVHLIC